MIKPIELPKFWKGYKTVDMELLFGWFDSEIGPINKAIRDGVEVQGIEDKDWGWSFSRITRVPKATHRALLIGIEPIKAETCAELLAELLNTPQDECTPNNWEARAKAALERERGE